MEYLSQKKEGIHHIAFFVEDIEIEMRRLKKEGIYLINFGKSHIILKNG